MAKKTPGTRKIPHSAGEVDWRIQTLDTVRQLILAVDPEIAEERKWVKATNPEGVPVWSRAGLLCTGEIYREVVKLTFAHGAALPDPAGLFNASLEGSTRRAIDIRKGESLDSAAFQTLIRAAIARNLGGTEAPKRAKKSPTSEKGPVASPSPSKPVKLLTGGNPQIAKADGEAPVQAYIAAMPGWKSDLGQRLDGIITRVVPDVSKAVRWNSPFYGIEGKGWFLSFHTFTRYVKVTFFAGLSLSPIPPGGTEKSKDARWLDIYETDAFDEAQMEQWVKQAAALPGWVP